MSQLVKQMTKRCYNHCKRVDNNAMLTSGARGDSYSGAIVTAQEAIAVPQSAQRRKLEHVRILECQLLPFLSFS